LRIRIHNTDKNICLKADFLLGLQRKEEYWGKGKRTYYPNNPRGLCKTQLTTFYHERQCGGDGGN
jgi:hypothetical protein